MFALVFIFDHLWLAGLVLIGSLVLLGAGVYLVNRREGWISVSISEKKSSRKPGRKK